MDKEQFDYIFYKELGGMNAHVAQDPQELWKVVQRLNIHRPRRSLEIGAHYGGSTRFWQLLTEEIVVAIDLDKDGISVDFSGHSRPLILHGSSLDPEVIVTAQKLAPYDFLFIDGDHAHSCVRADWDNYYPMVRPGGLIGLHDVGAMGTGPEILVQELRKEGFHCEILSGHKGTALVDIPEQPC